MNSNSKWQRNVLLTPNQAREIDKRTISETSVSGLELMERAGIGATKHILRLFPKAGTALFLLGKGNNAGDGYVIARLLLKKGWKIIFCPIFKNPPATPDAKTNYDFFYHKNPDLFTEISLEQIEKTNPTILLDCVFGTGFSGTLDQNIQTIFEKCNSLNSFRLGIDGPSGLNGETGRASGKLIHCNQTFAFGRSKIGFYINDGPKFSGCVTPIDIGFPKEYEPQNLFSFDEFVRSDVLPSVGRHKYDNGVVHIVSGSSQYRGAPVLCAKASHLLGMGAIFLHVPQNIVSAILPLVPPDVITIGYGNQQNAAFSEADLPALYSRISDKPGSVVFGPGIGRIQKTKHFVEHFVHFLSESEHQNCVIDADALTLLRDRIPVFKHQNCVLTPHKGEAKQLGVVWENDVERMTSFEEIVAQFNINVLSKGEPTMLFSPKNRSWIATYSSIRFSHAGLGDVLSGLIGAFSTQFAIHEACLNALAFLNERYHQLRRKNERITADLYANC